MKIAQRTSVGWIERENKKPELCDKCGRRLWIGPTGKPYCDNIHIWEEFND